MLVDPTACAIGRSWGSGRRGHPGHPTCANTVLSPPLATADEIVLQHAELL